jgi:hypothetical protein
MERTSGMIAKLTSLGLARRADKRFPNRKDGNYMYTNQKILSCLCLDLRGLGPLATAIVVLSVPANANLILNGGFDGPGGPTVPYAVFLTPPPGWSFSPTGPSATAPVACVVNSTATCYPNHANDLYSFTASPDGGNAYLDDGDPSFAGTLSQTINNLTPNASYTVSFFQAAGQFTSQTGITTEQWQVTFGSDPPQLSTLMTNPSKGFTGWIHQSMNFIAQNATEVLSFFAVGTPNGLPPVVLLDGVSVVADTNDPPFQVSYAANLNIGESYLDFCNDGANGASLLGPGFGGASGNICLNVYTFDPGEELVSCCSCLITPDQCVNLGVNRDLTVKTLTSVIPTSVTIKMVATLAGAGGTGSSCTNSAANVTGSTLVNGITPYRTTLHANPTGGYDTTETPFTPATLSAGELASIGGRCAAILGNGSGFGVCNSCRAGALGASPLPQ